MSNEEWTEFMKESIASHDRQIAELVENGARLDARIAAQGANIDKLVQVSNRDAIDIAALARIAEARGRRLERHEGGDSA
jgi:hypothetical protein